jgi:hypothetical protein
MNVPVTGSLQSTEVENFRFTVKGTEKQNITVHLQSDVSCMIVRECLDHKKPCSTNWTDIVERQALLNIDPTKLFLYSLGSGDQSLLVQSDPSQCHHNKCHYNVAVFPDKGNLSATESFKYELTVKSNQHYIILKENTPHKDFIQMGDMNYYIFTLPENEAAMRIQFYLTPIQGSQQAFVAKSILFPTPDAYERLSTQNVVKYAKEEEGGSLQGTYYVGVKAWSSGMYMITAQVVRHWSDMRFTGTFSYQYTQLFEGVEHQGSASKSLFKIDLSDFELLNLRK